MPDMYEATATCKKQAKVRVTENSPNGLEPPIVEMLCEKHAPRLSDLMLDNAEFGIDFVMQAV